MNDIGDEFLTYATDSNREIAAWLAYADYLQAQQQPSTPQGPILVQGKPVTSGANNGYISVLWTLKGTDGKLYYVTEQQSLHDLSAHKNSGRGTDYPNQFDDTVGTTPALAPRNSFQTFSISLSPPDKNGWSAGSMHVDVLMDGKRYYGVYIHLDASKGGPGTYEIGVNPPGYKPE